MVISFLSIYLYFAREPLSLKPPKSIHFPYAVLKTKPIAYRKVLHCNIVLFSDYRDSNLLKITWNEVWKWKGKYVRSKFGMRYWLSTGCSVEWAFKIEFQRRYLHITFLRYSHVFILRVIKQMLGSSPFDWQAALLRSTENK